MCPLLSWRARTSVRSERSWDEEDGRMDFLRRYQTSPRQTTWCGRTWSWFHRVFHAGLLCSSPAWFSLHTPVSNQINQPRPSPALHLLHWTFQLIIHVSASGVFLFLSLTCVSPPALISLVRFVCVSACVVGSLFVGPSVQLSSSRTSCYPAAFMCSPVCSLFLLYSLSKLPSPVGLLWPVCLSTFGFSVVLITYKRHEDTHILSVLAFGSCVPVDWSSSHGCQPLLLLDLMDQKSRLHSRHFDCFSWHA